jgi:glycine cleavage system H protein
MTPKEYRYTQEHEWLCPESRNKGKAGLADYAQSQLGDIVFLDLPAPGTQVEQGKKMGEVESVKAVSSPDGYWKSTRLSLMSPGW